MNQRSNSQVCFDYLLDHMEPKERKRFERSVDEDDKLASTLLSCTDDLTRFAEGSAPLQKPSGDVWKAISADIRNNTIDFPADKAHRTRRGLPWFVIWPAAAGILLALNLLQFFWPRSGFDGPGLVAENGVQDSVTETLIVRDTAVSEEQLQTLRDEIAVLQESLTGLNQSMQAKELELESRDVRLTNLEEEREALVQQIDNLEQNYLALLDMASPVLSNEIDSRVGVAREYVSVLQNDDSSTVNGIWDRVGELLALTDIAVLSVGTREGSVPPEFGDGFGIVGSERLNEPETSLDPYALAFQNAEANQTILTLGNLPELSRAEEMHLWTRDRELDTFVSIGTLPRELHGASGDIAAQLPEQTSADAELVITVEDTGFVGDEPMGTVLLRTQNPPEP